MKIVSREGHAITIGMGEAGTPLPLVLDIRVEYATKRQEGSDFRLTVSMAKAVDMTQHLIEILDNELIRLQHDYQKQVDVYHEMREKIVGEFEDE